MNDTSLSAAQELRRRGFFPVPTSPGRKHPTIDDWQNLRIEQHEAASYWNNGQGVGILLVDGLVDADGDCPEARAAMRAFLPTTNMVSGRASAPGSHFFYICDPMPGFAQFNDPTVDKSEDRARLFELRTRGQTQVPPSVNPPSQEQLRWERDGDPAHIDGRVLHQAAGRVAASALIARHYAPRGRRDELAMALSTVLIKGGWSAEDTDYFVSRTAEIAGDDEARQRMKAERTAQTLTTGRAATGWPTVIEILGKPVADAIERWLGLTTAFNNSSGKGGGADPESAPVLVSDGLFHLTDLGNAERLVARHGRDLRYCRLWKTWLAYDGKRWAVDRTDEVIRRAKETVRSIYAEAAQAEDDKLRAAIVGHAKRSEGEARIRAMISLAESEPGIPVAPAELDSDPFLFNTLNGTIDLRGGRLRAHAREDLITKLAPVEYNPAAPCRTFHSFLDKILKQDSEVIGYLQRVFGYALTGDISEQVLLLFHGLGANGKSTLLEVLRLIWGEYAMHTPTETLMVKRGDGGVPNDLARLVGARFVSAVETEDGKRLAESLVKQVTGGDPIAARFMRAEWFEFTPSFKLFLAANHKPVIRGTDNAIWRRVRLIPFEVTIPEEEQDKNLKDKLRAEASGILAWAVRGCTAWQDQGLQTPEAVIAATGSYRSDMDVLSGFLADRCTTATGARVAAKDLYESYVKWCEENGERADSQRTLGQRLQERGFEPGRTGKARLWKGLGLADDPQQTDIGDA